MKKKFENTVGTTKKDEIVTSYSWMIYALGLVSFLLYANTFMHGFVLDDIAVVEQNKFVKDGLAGIPDILSTFYWQGYWNSNAGLYRPMSLIFFAFEWDFMPNSPFIHHFCNVLLYALSIMLLFTVIRHYLKSYSVWITFFSVLLFAVHPIHTEVVSNIKSRDEILCLLFFTMTVYCLFVKTSKWFVIFGIISFLFCLLSKEAGILYLPILAILFWNNSKNIKSTFVKTLPFAIVSILWLLWHQYIIQSSLYPKIIYTYQDNSLINCSDKLTQMATGISILGRYIVNCFFPYNLSYDYSFNQVPCVGLTSIPFLGSLLLIIGLFAVAIKYFKKVPVIAFGIFFFFVTIFLVTNIFIMIGATMGDRLLYAPVLGICMTVVYALFYMTKNVQLQKFSHALVYALFLISVVFSFITFNRNKVWKSNFTLFTTDVKNAPNSARTHFNNATALFSNLPEDINEQQSSLPGIISEYEKALKIDAKDKGALTNLGVCNFRIKEYKKSVSYTAKAIELNRKDYSLYGNLADAYFMDKQYDNAIKNYKIVIQNKAIQFNTYNFFGVALFSKKEYSKAIQVFEEGLKLNPEHAEMHLNYGNALAISKKYKEAIAAFEKSYQFNPNQKQALYFISMCYQGIGNIAKADYYKKLYDNAK